MNAECKLELMLNANINLTLQYLAKSLCKWCLEKVIFQQEVHLFSE